MKDNKVLYGITAVVIIVFGAWAWGWWDTGQYSSDPQVAELEKLRDANVAKGAEPSREQRQEMRQRMEGMTEQQRMAFFESSMPIFVPIMAKRFEEEYDKFMKLSPEEQRKKLDERIDEMEKRGGGGPGGPRGGRPPIDQKKASEIAKKMLDWTTPEQRAKFENGMQIMNNRREERGLQPLPPFGGGF